METVVPPPADAELHLLTDWSDPAGRKRRGWAGVLSVLANVTAIGLLILMPEAPPYQPPQETVVTPLIDPPLTITQKEPNQGKAIKEIRSADLSPRVKAPAGPSPEPQAPAPRKPATPPPPPKAAPPPPLPEPPKVEIAASEQPKLTLPVTSPQVPQPKTHSAFEDVEPTKVAPPSQRVMDLPGPSVASAIRGNLRGPGVDIPGTAPVASSGAELPQLLSDPQGVDFRPYLARVLASVKRYWFLIMPQSRRRGDVSVQFAIQHDGTVRTVAFVQQTGDTALDNAAVAAISGGGPFGALPMQYHGNEIHVQMNFAYNAPKR
jgi:TonB family protein